MKLQFLGVGGAFAPVSVGNSNMMLTAKTGKRFLIDFGTTAPYIFRDEMKLNFGDIDALWATHLHGDHVGGIEMLAFARYFMPLKDANGKTIKPKLYANNQLMKDLWDDTLKGGLESMQGKLMHLADYFDCRPIFKNKSFVWEGHHFTPAQTIHVTSGYIIKDSFGLLIVGDDKTVFISSDTQFCPDHLKFYYEKADIIFHDCETLTIKSGVHSHYSDLNTLPKEYKDKMWLYHYGSKIDSYKSDGFRGFVDKFDEFDF